MANNSTKPLQVQTSIPVTGGAAEPTRLPVCAICGQLASTAAFVADAGRLDLCKTCFDLFGFGGKDGSPK